MHGVWQVLRRLGRTDSRVDYKRISAVDWSEQSDNFKGASLFRELKTHESAGTPYTHAIKEGPDGHCSVSSRQSLFYSQQEWV